MTHPDPTRSRTRAVRAALAGVLIAGLTAAVAVVAGPAAAAPPTGFADTVVANATLPVGLDFTPDGRMLVTTKPGHLYAVKNGTSTQALDASGFVCAGAPGQDERGMLSVAVDPSFASNNFIYVYYSHSSGSSCFNRVSRFTLDSSSHAAPASEKVLLDGIAGDGFHNAGDLAFGKDGNLYVAVGDGHCLEGCDPSNNAAQDLKNLNGKVLRIKSDGSVPSGNPYSGTGTARCNTGAISSGKCQEIYAYGFRNPFRLAVDPNATATRIYVDDVGQNTTEEVDLLKAGGNFGWPKCEGPCNTSGLTDPVFSYPDNSGGGRAAITGGAFVPNNAWNSAYNGDYLFSDYVKNNIYLINGSNGGFKTFSAGATAIAMKFAPQALGSTGGQQALYYTNLTTGTVHRITFGTTVPNASFSTLPGGTVSSCSTHATTAGDPPLPVTFNGSASSDPNGRPLTYHWDFGDGATGTTTTASTSHTYTTRGNFTPKLTVSNDNGATSTVATGTVRTDFAPPTINITSPTASDRFTVGQAYTPTGSATDSTGAALPTSALTWQVWLFHISHVHPVLDPTPGNGATTFTAPPAEQLSAINGNSRLFVCLSATDSHGITQTVEQDFNPLKVQLALASQPSGLKIHIDEDDVDTAGTVTTPATITSWAGYQIHVTAANQGSNTFSSWSDGGAQSHAITTPGSAATYTANFTTSTTQLFEAENATVSQGAISSNHLNYSGTGFVDYTNIAGSYVEWPLTRAAAGSVTLTVRYANGTTVDRPMNILVNGTVVATGVSFPGTGSWDTWANRTVTVALPAGADKVRATATTANGGPNVDYLQVTG